METLLAALGHPTRLSVIEHLLGIDADPPTGPRPATQAEMKNALRLNPGTLSKGLGKLHEARLVAKSPGPRADQPIYEVRQAGRLMELLGQAHLLDSALASELATLHRVEAEIKSERAARFLRSSE